MEINEENKVKRNFKRFGTLALAGLVVIGVVLAIALSVSGSKVEEVSTQPLQFGVPMNNAVVLKDYSETNLQRVEGAPRFEIHLSVDLASDDNVVMSVCDGVVTEIQSDTTDGTVIKIKHDEGFVSVYGSLDENLSVKEGDVVRRGQEIGKASKSAGYEKGLNADHLHFTLFKDGLEVDPNNYLDLQNK